MTHGSSNLQDKKRSFKSTNTWMQQSNTKHLHAHCTCWYLTMPLLPEGDKIHMAKAISLYQWPSTDVHVFPCRWKMSMLHLQPHTPTTTHLHSTVWCSVPALLKTLFKTLFPSQSNWKEKQQIEMVSKQAACTQHHHHPPPGPNHVTSSGFALDQLTETCAIQSPGIPWRQSTLPWAHSGPAQLTAGRF